MLNLLARSSCPRNTSTWPFSLPSSLFGKAYQTKRKMTRIEELRSGVPKTSVDRAISASSTHFDQEINIMDVPHRSHYSNTLSTALARDSAPTVDELSNLSGDLTSHPRIKTTSTRAQDLSRLELSLKSLWVRFCCVFFRLLLAIELRFTRAYILSYTILVLNI